MIFDFDPESRAMKRNLKVGMLLVGIFLISGFKSCTQIRYSLSGVTTNATIYKAYEEKSVRTGTKIVIRYHFTDEEGKHHKAGDRINVEDWIEPLGKDVEIIYLPSDPETATLTYLRSWGWSVIFLVMLVAMGIWSVNFYIKAQKGIL